MAINNTDTGRLRGKRMLYDCGQWIRDLDRVSALLPELEELRGKSVLITGASGLICSAVADILFRYNDLRGGSVQVYAAGRSPERMETRFGDLVRRPDFHFVFFDACAAEALPDVRADYIIHGASSAYPALYVREPVETMTSVFLGTKALLETAKASGTRRLLMISTSEVYGQKQEERAAREGEYGYIDLLNERNSYSVSKRAAETLCASYAAEYGVESVIVRPGHIYGPTAGRSDNRVSSAWAFTAARGEDIVMKSDGAQIRSYCYAPDCASAILKVLLRGEAGHAYNISNPDSIISIREMGEILAKAGGVRLKKETAGAEEKRGFNPMSNSSLESGSLEGLGWRGCFSAEEGLTHTVEILKEVYGTERSGA